MIGRFINADGYMSTGQDFLGFNMYAYCLNNPVNMIDNSGEMCWFYEPDSAKSAYISGYNDPDTIAKIEEKQLINTDEAKMVVDHKLKPYYKNDDDCNLYIYDNKNGFRINNSYLVDSMEVRLYVSSILSRTKYVDGDGKIASITFYDYETISAEWKLHNDLYIPTILIENLNDSVASVDIGLNEDHRSIVRFFTNKYKEKGCF